MKAAVTDDYTLLLPTSICDFHFCIFFTENLEENSRTGHYKIHIVMYYIYFARLVNKFMLEVENMKMRDVFITAETYMVGIRYILI